MPSSSAVEHSTVNRLVAGSIPAWAVGDTAKNLPFRVHKTPLKGFYCKIKYIDMDINTKISEFIFVARNIIPKEICEYIVNDTNEIDKWIHGSWYNYGKNERTQNTHSTSAIYCLNKTNFVDYIIKAREIYLESVVLPTRAKLPVGRVTTPFVNKYEEGQFMDTHVDHIQSIFDGKQKGIPVMTSLGILNDDYEGGEFVMYDDFVVDIKVGDILLFPSLFLYPHRVNEITKGTRYSWISWWF